MVTPLLEIEMDVAHMELYCIPQSDRGLLLVIEWSMFTSDFFLVLLVLLSSSHATFSKKVNLCEAFEVYILPPAVFPLKMLNTALNNFSRLQDDSNGMFCQELILNSN